MNTHVIKDLQEDYKNHIKQYGYDLIDYSQSVPGEGYGYLICLQDFPIAFLVERFHFVCNSQDPIIIYNDPDSMGRWTVQPYRYRSHSEAFYKIGMMSEAPIYLNDADLVGLTVTCLSMRNSYQKNFLLNSQKLWEIIKISTPNSSF